MVTALVDAGGAVAGIVRFVFVCVVEAVSSVLPAADS